MGIKKAPNEALIKYFFLYGDDGDELSLKLSFIALYELCQYNGFKSLL